MAKKIFDIIPPEEDLKEEHRKLASEKKPEVLTKKEKTEKPIPLILKLTPVFLLAILIIGGFLYFSLDKATVEIWPKTEAFNYNTKITIDKSVKQIDISQKSIPGTLFTVDEMTTTQEFSSTGQIKKKALGTIRVYNNYSSSVLNLRANTRFMSDAGLVFQSTDKISIPGKPGYVDVKVIAVESGTNYNIEPATFSIPGLVGTSMYTYFYGKSLSKMTGGGSGPQVTQEDLNKAKEQLTAKALNDCQIALKNKVSQEFIFLQNAADCEVTEAFSPVKAGLELDKFIYTVKTNGKIVAFKDSDIKDFARKFVNSQVAENNVIDEASFKINYSVDSVDSNTGKVIISLQLGGKTYLKIDEVAIKKSLANKSAKESEFLLENQQDINKASVKLWPFWVSKVPNDSARVEMGLNLD